MPLVALAQPAEAEAAIVRIADATGVPLFLEGRDWQMDMSLRPALAGDHQVRNANLAWQMLNRQDALAVPIADRHTGLASAHWPARFERLTAGPIGDAATWIDGAHNPQAADALGHLLNTQPHMHVIVGILANKDADGIIAALRPHALSLTFVPVPDHPSHDPAALADKYGGRSATDLEQALAVVPAPRLVAGSLYLAGLALQLNRQCPD